MDWQLFATVALPTVGVFIAGNGLYRLVSRRGDRRPAVETMLVGFGVALAFLSRSVDHGFAVLATGVVAILAAAISAAGRRTQGTPRV